MSCSVLKCQRKDCALKISISSINVRLPCDLFMIKVSCVSLTDCHLESLFGTEDWGTGYKNCSNSQYQSFIDIFKVFFVSVIYNWHNSLRCLASVRSVVLGIALYRRFHTSGFADVLVKSTGL